MDLVGKKILVIGGAGFIGSYIITELLKEKVAEIVIFDDLSRGTMNNIAEALKDSRVRIYEKGGNILHIDILNDAMKGMDGVFHLSALWLMHCDQFPRAAFHVNIEGTFNVLEACRDNNIKRLVYSSSASVYSNAIEKPMTENHPLNGKNFYGATKIAGEAMLTAFVHKYNLSAVGLRYMNVYGKGHTDHGAYVGIIPRTVRNIMEGKAPIIHGTGSQAFDFIHVKDVAIANICAMKAETSGEFYNISTGIQTSIKEVIAKILKATNSKLQPEYQNPNIDNKTLVTDRIGSTEKAEKDLGFKYSIELDKGIEITVK